MPALVPPQTHTEAGKGHPLLGDTFSALSSGTLRLFVKSWLPLPMQWMPCVTQPCGTLLLRDLPCTLALVGTGATRSQPSHPGPPAVLS